MLDADDMEVTEKWRKDDQIQSQSADGLQPFQILSIFECHSGDNSGSLFGVQVKIKNYIFKIHSLL